MKISNFKLKIFNFLLFFPIFYLLSSLLGLVFAQPSRYFLSAIPYQTREDLDFLFSQSSRVIDYLEGEGVEEPIFLTIITEPQRQNLMSKDFKIKVLDGLNNLNDINNYTLLYHPQPDQSNLLSNRGKILVVSPHYTLLKTTPEKPFKHEGEAAKFFIIPFAKEIVTPPYRTKTIVPPTKPPLPLITPTPLPSPLIKTVFVSLFLSLIISGVIYLFSQRREKKLPIRTVIMLFGGLLLIIGFLISKLIPKPNYPTPDLEIKETEEF